MIINTLLSLFLIGTFLYFAVLVLVIWGLIRLPEKKPRYDLRVSVLIPFLNERENLPALIDSLAKLTYPADMYEVIFINDGSTDGGEEIVKQHLTSHPNWRLIEMQRKSETLRGKKYAITEAVKHSTGEIILTTDADCLVPPNWIQSMAGYIDDNAGMVIGHSPLTGGKGFLYRLQCFDNLCGDASAMAGAYFNKPPHSNGRNLMYRKTAFFSVGGFSSNGHVDSGDDFFLSQSIYKQSEYSFTACSNPDSFVKTKPLSWGKRFIHQQMRRDGKAFHLTPGFLLTSIAIALHILLLPVFLLFPVALWIKITIILLKIVLEFSGVWAATGRLKMTYLRKWYPVMGIVYPPWMFVFSLLGSLKLYRWK